MPSCRAQAWNANARNANAVPLVPDKEVQMQSFRMPIHLLVQSMTNHNNQQVLVPTNKNDRSVAAKFVIFQDDSANVFRIGIV